MTDPQWKTLTDTIKGKLISPLPVGFIIDSPWLPGWYGISTLQYYSSGEHWFNANLKAIETFPEVMFLPGFWSEFGMCTEPSAFGSKLSWSEYSLPHAGKTIGEMSEVRNMKRPDPRKDGLMPFVLQRLVDFQERIRQAGHEVRFAVSRGPLNIAAFLAGTTEFMAALLMDPDACHKLLRIITDFSIDWLQLQKETFPSIEGILVLDDIVGFLDDQNCREFALPYLKEIFKSIDAEVKFFHNDAHGIVSSPYLKDMGINLFNFSFEHSFREIRQLAGEGITLLGNLPPRDVLALGTAEDVRRGVKDMVASVDDRSRIIWSVGGGMPQDVSTENLTAFLETLKKVSAV